MKKYSVCLTRDITETCTVEVEAESKADAYGKAHDAANNYGDDWRTTDWVGDTHYVATEVTQ